MKNFATLACTVLFISPPLAAAPVSGLYQITSGRFGNAGSGRGEGDYPLPTQDQLFIELIMHGEYSMEMRIRGTEMEPWRTYDPYNPYLPYDPFGPHAFSNGSWEINHFGFEETLNTFWGIGELDYTLQWSGDDILLNGSLTITRPSGFDMPRLFYHTDVRATLVPEPGALALTLFGVISVGAARVRRPSRRNPSCRRAA